VLATFLITSHVSAQSQSHIGNFPLLERCFSFADSVRNSLGLIKVMNKPYPLAPGTLEIVVNSMSADLDLIYVAAGPRVLKNIKSDPGNDWPNEFLSMTALCSLDASNCNYDGMWSRFQTFPQRLKTDCSADYRGEI
jgi:hypothetical protein